MSKHFTSLAIFALLLTCAWADDRWIWNNRNNRNFHNDNIDRLSDYETLPKNQLNRRSERTEREPTTKRPIPGSVQSDDIDDYTDADGHSQSNIGIRQNYPYTPNGLPPAGHFNAFGNSGGNAANGILVGPGGPTGIIGRPTGPEAFGGGLNYPQNQFGGTQYPNTQYPQGFGGFPGQSAAAYPPIAQNGLFNNGFNQQYPSAPAYPIQGYHGSLGGNVGFPSHATPGYHPSSGFQPQYPLGGQHQYTEGYGLANNHGFANNFLPNAYNGGFYGGYNGNAFDEGSKAKYQVEGKNAESRAEDKNVDDKINKNFVKKV